MKFSKQQQLSSELLVIDGMWGSGKSVITQLVSVFDSMECWRIDLPFDNIPVLYGMDSIEESAAITLIRNLFDEMTITEKTYLLNNTFQDIWNNLWGDFSGVQYANEEKISNNKFNSIKEGVYLYDNTYYNLKSLIHNSKTSWMEPEWGFPKGRRNYLENDLDCAIREFTEETGLLNKCFKIIKNIVCFL